ncbi:sulfatase family protein [Sunxiuqinia sp. A32]|uniref:sulfatase family protein n=1 Tax=Sunxiuqinia sp. A32 TaxID=3461496 RepID=UPI00404579C7
MKLTHYVLSKKLSLFASSLLLLLPGVGKSGNTVSEEKTNKNILVFIADDLARNELGCYGGQNVKTPNIDRFAKEGVRFNQMYASEAMCAPTRASIYTGLYPVKHGVYKNHAATKTDVISIVQYIGNLGYRVGLTGKTHFKPELVYPFEIIDGFEKRSVSKTANYKTDGIVEFMNRREDQPFCLIVCSTLPHAPWTAGDPSVFDAEKLKLPPHFVDNKETRQAFIKYLAEIAYLDKQFGDVLSALKSTSDESNTIVMFCGEQGPQFPGGKWTSWDYGQKSAFIVRTPKGAMNGKVSDALLQYEDVLPTLISYVGGKVSKEMDGESFLPVLNGEKTNHREWAYGIHNNFPEGTPYPIRSIRNNQYKLIVNLSPELKYFEKHLMNPNKESYWDSWVRDAETSVEAKHWVDRYISRPAIEFYDIENDPWELNNLASEENLQPIIRKMEKELYNWMKKQGDPGKELDVEVPRKS